MCIHIQHTDVYVQNSEKYDVVACDAMFTLACSHWHALTSSLLIIVVQLVFCYLLLQWHVFNGFFSLVEEEMDIPHNQRIGFDK